jgi:hypothetical protein
MFLNIVKKTFTAYLRMRFTAIFLPDLDKNNLVCVEEGAFQDLKGQLSSFTTFKISL